MVRSSHSSVLLRLLVLHRMERKKEERQAGKNSIGQNRVEKSGQDNGKCRKKMRKTQTNTVDDLIFRTRKLKKTKREIKLEYK